jgi:hypothetical protein
VTGSYIGKPAGKKLLRLSLEWDGDRVVSASIRGDFFAHPEEAFEAAEAALAGTPAASLGETFARELSARGVELFGVSPEDVGAAAADILARAAAEGRAT